MKIVLLHGALGAGDQMTHLASKLKEKGVDPVILELPGHGNTPLSNHDFSITGFADWLEQEMNKYQLWENPFFGFSMGGYIMLYLLSKKMYPVKQVITLGTKFKWDPESALEETKKLNPDKILEKVPMFAQMLDIRHLDWKETLLNTKKLMNNLGEKPLLTSSAVHDINVRTTILRGETDNMVTEEESLEIANALPNGSYKMLPGMPHPLEQVPVKDIVNEIIEIIGYGQK